MDENALSQILDLLYGASINEALWQPFMKSLLDATGSVGGALILTDSRQPSPLGLQMLGSFADIADDYASNWWQYDPKPAFAEGKVTSQVFSNLDYESALDEAGREFRKWEQSTGIHDHITGFAVVNQHVKFGLSIPGRRQRSVVTRANQKLFCNLVPHMRRAAELGWSHAQALDELFWQQLGGLNAGRAVVLLDANGLVLRASPSAVRILDARDGIAFKKNQLICSDPNQQDQLDRRIAAAIRGHGAAGGSMLIPRPSGRSSLILRTYPIKECAEFFAIAGARALISVVDRSSEKAADDAAMQRLFNLTAREAQLAVLLHMGHSVETASFSMGISLPTARLYLRRILAKTETTRQSDLLKLLTLLCYN